MVELVEPLQQQPLDQDAERADDQRRQQQRRPVADAELVEQQERRERAHHVLRAVGEIDDVEHAEDDGEAEAQQRVERAVDQPEQKLPEQRRRRNAEDFEHGPSRGSPPPFTGRCQGGSTDSTSGVPVRQEPRSRPSPRKRGEEMRMVSPAPAGSRRP